jgi:hypothetical protein
MLLQTREEQTMTQTLADMPARERVKPTREEALAIAERRKAARRARTKRIRRAIAVVSVVAFIGPFGLIYSQLAAGHDPALSSNQGVDSVASASSGSNSSGSSVTAGPSSPAPVTTQQS